MKASLLIIIGLLFFHSASIGQTNHATFFIGTDTKLDFSSINSKWKNETDEEEYSHYTNFELSPKFGIYAVNGLAIGVYIPISMYSENYESNYYKSNSFGIGPFIRYYFNTEKVKPFFNGGVGLGITNVKGSSSNSTSGNILFLEVGTGIGIFVNKTVSIDIGAGYQYKKIKPIENNINDFRVIS